MYHWPITLYSISSLRRCNHAPIRYSYHGLSSWPPSGNVTVMLKHVSAVTADARRTCADVAVELPAIVMLEAADGRPRTQYVPSGRSVRALKRTRTVGYETQWCIYTGLQVRHDEQAAAPRRTMAISDDSGAVHRRRSKPPAPSPPCDYPQEVGRLHNFKHLCYHSSHKSTSISQ